MKRALADAAEDPKQRRLMLTSAMSLSPALSSVASRAEVVLEPRAGFIDDAEDGNEDAEDEEDEDAEDEDAEDE